MRMFYNRDEDVLDSYDSYEEEELKEWEEVDIEEEKRLREKREEEEKLLAHMNDQMKFVETMRDMMEDQGYDTSKNRLLKS